jgi:hypothetical protein
LRAGDGYQTLVAVVSWLVDLDDTSTELADLVDLCAALSNDRTNHIVGNEYLLGERLAGHRNRRLVRCTAMGDRSGAVVSAIRSGLGRAAVVSASR